MHIHMYIYIYILIFRKIKPTVLELDFWADYIFVLPLTGFEHTALINYSTYHLALCQHSICIVGILCLPVCCAKWGYEYENFNITVKAVEKQLIATLGIPITNWWKCHDVYILTCTTFLLVQPYSIGLLENFVFRQLWPYFYLCITSHLVYFNKLFYVYIIVCTIKKK